MKDDYTSNSHYLTCTFLFREVGRMFFLNLRMKGLKSWENELGSERAEVERATKTV